MDELRRASITYYNTSTSKEKKLARKVFKAMDTDGDGRVGVAEFSNFLSKHGLKRFNQLNFFTQLDKDNNGYLDFDEVLLFYYIVRTRPGCDMCGTLIMGMYYSCVKCFSKAADSCDLCPSCHSLGTFKHRHAEFLDNYALLRKQRPSTSTSEAFGLGMDLGGLLTDIQNGCNQM
ncbi:uncharacterized protein LOC131244314 [Magnolia sinica]|uniref:uncharacterized protein LOC131244314 n=1 Tax=Magnolia sinica TaxID=86752 RepID=UPI00265AD7FF|nr:uncharacterized protein LOC131244314 [Magnolia sinica]